MSAGSGFDERSVALRRELLRVVEKAGRGHIGSALSILEILRVLYDEILRYRPEDPAWSGRDRFLMSKGHGCLAFYLLLAEKGFFPKEELDRVCEFDALLGGHPEALRIPGVELSTGSLGHGLAVGVGMALAARMRGESWRTFVLVGDGECNEGSVWEAALCAGKHRLSGLTLLVDYNKMQCYSTTREVLDLEPFADKWRAFGFEVREVDGHDVEALRKVLQEVPFVADRPGALICHTVKGKGFPTLEWNPAWHHKSRLKDEELVALRRDLEALS